MIKQRTKLPAFTLLIIIVFSGCAATRGNDSFNRYQNEREVSYVNSVGIEENTSQIEITENSELSDYLAYAALNNPGLKAAFNRWKSSLEKIPQVKALPDPRFTYSYFIEHVETRVGPQRHKLDISQTFPWFGKLELLGDVAFEEANIQRQAYEKLKLSLFFEVKAVYYEYYYLSQSIYITEENMKLLSYFENVAQTKYTTGMASQADVIKAQVELGKLEERLLSLRDLREPVTAKLNAALNRPANAPIPWPSSIQDDEITLTDDEIINQIVDNNPDLKALEYTIEKVTKSGELAKKEFYPNIMFGISYVETGPSSMPGTKESGKDPVMTMLSINLPIWRDKYRAAVNEADIKRISSERELENRENMLIADLKTSLYNYRDAERKKELFRDTLIPKARQALNVTQSAFEAGKKDFLSLIDTQRTLLEFELSYERALTDHAKFRAQIEMLAGKDI
ncbi:TolC family protein [Candidatus Latescibacterota bacterium]